MVNGGIHSKSGALFVVVGDAWMCAPPVRIRSPGRRARTVTSQTDDARDQTLSEHGKKISVNGLTLKGEQETSEGLERQLRRHEKESQAEVAAKGEEDRRVSLRLSLVSY